MPFELTKDKDNTIIFTFNEKFTESDFYKFLEVLDRLLKSEKPFAFIVDCEKSTMAPLKCGFVLVKWMRDRKMIIKKYLLGSCLITKYKSLVKIMNWVFKKQKPVSPNLITNDKQKGYEFIKFHVSGGENPSDFLGGNSGKSKIEENFEEISEGKIEDFSPENDSEFIEIVNDRNP